MAYIGIDAKNDIRLNATSDLDLTSDSTTIKFGADDDVTLTHVHNTGLLLNSTNQFQFGDSGTYIHQSADGVLDLVSDTEIEINATTIDINGAVDISGNATIGGSTVTDSNMLNIQGDGSSVNVGAVFNKTNSTAQIWSTQVRNSDNAFLIHNYTANSTPLIISTAGAATFNSTATFGGNITTSVDNTVIAPYGSFVGFVKKSGTAGSISYASSQSLIFSQSDASSLSDPSSETYSEKMRIDSDGDIFIGTSSDIAPTNGTNLYISDGTVSRFGLEKTGSDARKFSIGNGGTYLNIYDETADAERMRIGSGGEVAIDTDTFYVDAANNRVGIRSTNPHAFFDVKCGSDSRVLFIDSGGDPEIVAINDANTAYGHLLLDGNTIRFKISNNEKMRIDSSGHVFVAKTSSALATVGSELLNDGRIVATADNQNVLLINRKTSNGSLATFYKDGSEVGNIVTEADTISIGSGDTGLKLVPSLDALLPYNNSSLSNRDDAIDLGYNTVRFDDIYATNGTIQTSDEKEKNTIVDSDLGLDFIKRLSPKSYKFNNKTRTHYGLIAQDVETVLSDISKSNTDFAGLIKGDISENQDGSNYRYGLRYTELIAPMIKALQEANEKIETLEARIAKLEGG
jgi:phage gp45-like